MKSGDLWHKIMNSIMMNGFPYITFEDNFNDNFRLQHLGRIKSFNLCAEIAQIANKDTIGCCNLGSIVLPNYIRPGKGLDWKKLSRAVNFLVKTLDKGITLSQTRGHRDSSLDYERRQIGIGVQGMATTIAMLGLEYDSQDASRLDYQIFETIYAEAVETSSEMITQDNLKVFVGFEGSQWERGITAREAWLNRSLKKGTPEMTPPPTHIPNSHWGRITEMRWKEINKKVKQGMRHGQLTCVMPTVTTSRLWEVSESIDLPMAREVALRGAGYSRIWTDNRYDETKVAIRKNASSSTTHDRRHTHAGNNDMDIQIQRAINRTRFIDQSQSLNLFIQEWDTKKISRALFQGWRGGLKTGSYYIRTVQGFEPRGTKRKIKDSTTKNEE